MSIKDDQLIFRCFDCKKNYKKYFNKELIKRCANIYEFCNRNIVRFILLLRKGVYSYEYMDSWGRFDKGLLPEKEYFYGSLNKENITSIDYRRTERVFKKFNNKSLGDYNDLHVPSDTLLLADVFEYFTNKCIKICKFDPANFSLAPELTWEACLKKTGIKLELLTDANMLLMVENGIRGGICH